MIPVIAQVIDNVIGILIVLIIIRSVLSFLPQFKSNKLSMLLYDVTDPLLKPFQRLQIGGAAGAIDFSPIFAFIALKIIGWLSKLLLSLFY